ncbi:MAG TPA: helix-turn-helix domain-containing protein [Candidatus Binataceae bacterium]|nr:helix-turn-helix domain-containing protein [Candidatus Binataceae bacterium]
MTTKAGFGPLIRDRRCALKLTQEEIAQRIGTSAPYIGHLEAGKRHPSDETLAKLSEVLGIDPHELFFAANPDTKKLLQSGPVAQTNSAWDEFSRDLRVHRLYGITEKEMAVLSQIALMGDVGSPRDFIFVLNAIRHSLDS